MGVLIFGIAVGFVIDRGLADRPTWPWTSLVVIAALLALGLLTWVLGARYRRESDVSRIQREDGNSRLLREVHRAVLGHGPVSAQVVEYAAASVGATGPAGPPRRNVNAVVSLKGFAGSKRSGGTSGHLDIHEELAR